MASTISRSQVSPRLSIVRVVGELDLVTAPLLRAALRSADADPTHEFAVVLSAVSFMDCAGLTPLLEAHATLGRRLRLRDPSQAVWRLLRLVGLDASLAIDDATPAMRAGATPAPADDLASPSRDPRRTRPRRTPVEATVPDRVDDEYSGLGVLEAHLAGPGAALGNRVVIEQARGLLMASLDCDATQASRALLQISWAQDTTVVDAALALVAAAEDSLSQTQGSEVAATAIDRGTRGGAMVGSSLATDEP